jgi:hypothetical protein
VVGAAVRVTMVPVAYLTEQVPVTTPLASAQLVCAVLSVTLPLPVPKSFTVRESGPPEELPLLHPPRIIAHTRTTDIENDDTHNFMGSPLRPRQTASL